MADVSGFIWAGLAGGGLSAVLLSILAVLCKSQLAHWLNKDIERVKARHQQELEAYKVSLISEAESVKASQEIRKSMALRISEKRLDSIMSIHRGLRGVTAQLLALLKQGPYEKYHERLDEIRNRIQALSDAIDDAVIFFDQYERGVMYDLLEALHEVLISGRSSKAPITGNVFQTYKDKIMGSNAIVSSVLQMHVNSMILMIDMPNSALVNPNATQNS